MNDNLTINPQDLRARFAGIISMMLVILRAHGWRALIHLPTLWLAEREMRRIAAAFCELFDAWHAGLIAPATPAPAPQQPQAARAQSAATPRPIAPRHRRARRQPAPAIAAHAGACARTRVVAPASPMPVPRPLAIVRTSAAQKNPVLAASPSHDHFVTIS